MSRASFFVDKICDSSIFGGESFAVSRRSVCLSLGSVTSRSSKNPTVLEKKCFDYGM